MLTRLSLSTLVGALILAGPAPRAFAQAKPQATPRLVTFGGIATRPDGTPQAGVAGITFSLYKDEEGGAPLWMETQNVTLDAAGGYTAQIGATLPEGLPVGLFASDQARWLEAQVDGQPAVRRVLLVSVPYALKAVDAQTLGGLPASAYALAAAGTGAAGTVAGHAAAGVAPIDQARAAKATTPDLSGAGTTGTIPLWTGSATLGSSVLLQSGGNLGVGATSPSTTLLVLNPATTGNTIGVFGRTVSPTGVGVSGANTSSTGIGYGVVGNAFSSTGTGVYGNASSSSGTTYGVYGTAASPSGIGVEGKASSTTGTTYGVYGLNASSSGVALGANASSTSGVTYGVYAGNASSAGTAVEGNASSTTGTTFGVYGTVASVAGIGVEGKATATTGTTWAVYGSNASTSGLGVAGVATATSGTTYGVGGSTASTTGIGVQGQANATSGNTYGVVGIATSPTGIGVSGSAVAHSGTGGTLGGSPYGVWGDTTSNGAGVLATADSAEALAAYNNSTHLATLFVENDEDTKDDAIVLATYSDAYGGYCDVFVNGNLSCSGSVGGHANVGPSRDVAMYAVQSAENWFEDAGAGQLHNGAAVVTLDTEYAQTVNTGMDYHVFLTPNGDCKGLYVSQKSPTSFEVHELGGGNSSIAFDYRIMARRKGFESIRMADLTGKIQRTSSKNNSAARRGPVAAGALQAH